MRRQQRNAEEVLLAIIAICTVINGTMNRARNYRPEPKFVQWSGADGNGIVDCFSVKIAICRGPY